MRALARGALADRNLAVATAALEQYLRAVPHDAAAQFEAGWVAEQLGDVDGARHHYTAALESDPAHVPAALNLARSFRIGGQPQDAVAVCEAALRKTADDPRLLDALAASLRDEKKLDEAESIVRRVLERHPHEADAYKNLALIEADRGRVRLAEIALANARKLDANDPGIPNTLGILAMRRGEPAAARERFLEAVHLDERYAPAWANLGALALAYADAKAAHDAYAKAVALDPERYETHLGFAWALAALGKPAEARVEYESVLALRPAQEDAMFGRALSLKADNQLAAAKAVFEQLLSRGGPAHSTEARAQIASIDLRLRAAAGTATTAAAAPRPSQGSK
ncbi:MAG TPA: tetratricopeptide repeat protein [Myxococcales bacterium]|nr:tetratricopeptide repeat protein [Myxococcales bacterium]